MKRLFSCLGLIVGLVPNLVFASPSASTPNYGLVIHGGAGVIPRPELTPEREVEVRARIAEALDAGYAVLERGGPALDAVIAAVNVLEDSPLFNAGKGSVLNADGICELDASVMEGRTLGAGAVAGVHHIRNPVNLARDVMEKSGHVMLIGEGAEQFARSRGYEMMPPDYFQTEHRRQQLLKAKELEKVKATKSALLQPEETYLLRQFKWGTVGCVALDRAGNLAAGTSTGGMTNKKFGRIGDTPVIGAGTYANNATCAVSATGWGEFFIRTSVAHDISAQMEYAGRTVTEAARATLAKVGALGGDGGVIVLDTRGNVAMEFNSPGMYRGHRFAGQSRYVAIYPDPAKP